MTFHIWPQPPSGNIGKCPCCLVTLVLDENGACHRCTERYQRIIKRRVLRQIDRQHRNRYRFNVLRRGDPREADWEFYKHLRKNQ